MTRFGMSLGAALAWLATAWVVAAQPQTNPPPNFKEVYDLLRAHLGGTSEMELNRAAVEGLIAQLRDKVALADEAAAAAQTNVATLGRCIVLEEDVAYAQVGRVAAGLAGDLSAAVLRLNTSNQLKGVVLDLRFAGGDDYAAAAAAADLFVADAKPLLDWGDGPVKSARKFDIINLPVAVVVNRETTGAAEALAAVLRQTGTGLILGGDTAGSALVSREFTLQTGQRLRIGTTPVKLGDGTPLSPQGVQPDIVVAVPVEDERAYLQDAYARLPRSGAASGAGLSATNQIEGTNRPSRRPRTTEADLVRARRNGMSLDADLPLVRDTEPARPVIQDPALARAVDLLKGLAVVRKSRP